MQDWEQVKSFRVLSGFSKSAGKWLSCGIKVRLWRRAQFGLSQSDFIFADGAWDVCEGGHWLNVMNRWGALTMKIRCLSDWKAWKFQWNPAGCGRW